jgi:hypothetical protein
MFNDSPWLLSPAAIAAILLLLAGMLLTVGGVVALFKWRPLGFTVRTLSGLAVAFAGAIIGMVSIGTYGYTALTSDEVVATIEILPRGAQRFDARFIYRDGHTDVFAIAGDEVYIDARVLKWQPLATLAGLRTMYELDRIAGRYRSIEDERRNPRTIYPLAASKPFDLFSLRRTVASLSRFVDAEYGSAAFVPADKPVNLELAVTASGLIIRAKPAP